MKPASVRPTALQSPRRKVIKVSNGLISDRGHWRNSTTPTLSSVECEKLAYTFKLSQSQLEGLTQDARQVAAAWLLSAPTTDVYSNSDVQRAVQATQQFLESLEALTEAHKPALAVALKHLNPTWSDPTNWQIRQTLELMRSLSDQKGPGAITLDAPRTVEAVDVLVASWKRHTGRRPTKGAKRPTSPLRFYRALLPLLRVEHPRTIFVTAPAEFSRAELEAFCAAVEDGFIRGVDRWMKKNQGK